MPWCLQAVLEYVEQDFGNPPIYIYENGLCLFLTHSLLSSCSFMILFLCFLPFLSLAFSFGSGVLEETLRDSKKTLQVNWPYTNLFFFSKWSLNRLIVLNKQVAEFFNHSNLDFFWSCKSIRWLAILH